MKTARCRWVLAVSKLFNIAVNDFDTKETGRCNQIRCKGTQRILPTTYVVRGKEMYSQVSAILMGGGRGVAHPPVLNQVHAKPSPLDGSVSDALHPTPSQIGR